jgi:hypothetical protein
MAILIVPAALFALDGSPRSQGTKTVTKAVKERARRTIPAVPSQASHAHNIRLRIIKVTPLEQIGDTRLLKLEVERHYGKIDTVSLNRAKEHETSRFTILFPASLDADIRTGDLINYWLVGYTAIGRE